MWQPTTLHHITTNGKASDCSDSIGCRIDDLEKLAAIIIIVVSNTVESNCH